MTDIVHRESLKQRSDYTYKFNAKTGRHGWLRLTPAYSLRIVEELIANQGPRKRILDPFCGTGTTALCASYHGHSCSTIEINPFLVWLVKAKVEIYSTDQIREASLACRRILGVLDKKSIKPAPCPPIHNIERWWNPNALDFLRLLLAAIATETAEGSSARALLSIAFCRTLIELSNAAFNHQSMSFKNDNQLELGLEFDMPSAFAEDVKFVLAGAAENPCGDTEVVFGDSRDIPKGVEGAYDLVITSPPYVNRMSYIRELRPYMYWLGFLANGRDAGDLDWNAIGGTWGIATSRLIDWKRDTGQFQSPTLDSIINAIRKADAKNGPLLANYVAKYFDDMWLHFQGLTDRLAPGAELHYIVGNSTFYGIVVPTETLYAAMLQSLGFIDIHCQPIRKRNSKKELIEYDVYARWQS